MNKQVLIALIALNKAENKNFFRIKYNSNYWAGAFFLSARDMVKLGACDVPAFDLSSLILQWQRVIDFFEGKINFYIKNGLPVPAKFKNYGKKLKLEFI